MATFEWKPDYSVSVSTLDAQHRKLFALGQNLHDAMRAGRGREVLAKCLGDLADYTKTHFAEEESLLSSHNYPDLPTHRLQHSRLIRRLNEFQQQFASGEGFITIELMDFVSNWITNHIMYTDHRYADFFNKQGVY